ncbi:hypothetical protein FDA94_28815 [Herbidospora galbida]|uniref:Uncharacterized protein n=1 Tax=Herbidospora galbida TaxID=2575442 RepID=A0A4U3M9A0_9ACTN|nr:hypothetical protein [Herbidospora galbida]TKK84634.1 hypothetical protein FDA94_28815 [Herbidospora galbida]
MGKDLRKDADDYAHDFVAILKERIPILRSDGGLARTLRDAVEKHYLDPNPDPDAIIALPEGGYGVWQVRTLLEDDDKRRLKVLAQDSEGWPVRHADERYLNDELAYLWSKIRSDDPT